MKRIINTVAVALLISSCSTLKEMSTDVRRDSLYIYKEKLDIIYVRDSIFIREKGDTVFQYVERWRYHDRVTHDTIYRSKVDSVYVDRVTVQKVAKPLSWWQKSLMYVGAAAIILFVIFVLIKFL